MTQSSAMPDAVPTARAPFPYIVGMTRSGTTLLRAMLTSHPDLDIPDEAPFLVEMADRSERYEQPHGFDQEAFLTDLFGHPDFKYFNMPQSLVRRLLSDAEPSTFAEAMRALFNGHASAVGKPRYGDKTPRAVLSMPRLAGLFPEARFIHIIRDGRDVACSHKNIVTGMRNAAEVAVSWKYRVQTGRSAGRALGPGRYLEVRYEALVDDPEGTLRSVCEFVDLSFNPSMLTYFEHAKEIVGTPETAPLDKSIYLPPTKGLRDWRTQMSEKDLALFEAIGGDLLDELGYGRALKSIPLSASMEANLVRALVPLKGKANSVRRTLRSRRSAAG